MLLNRPIYIIDKEKLLSYLFIFTIFTKGLTVYPSVLNFGIDPYAYIAIPVFFVFLRLTYRELLYISFLAASVLVLNIIVISLMNHSYLLLLKQFIPIVIFYTASYAFFKKVDIAKIFKIYVKVSILVCCLGLLQFTLYVCGVSVYVDTPGRINSIIPEPSHLAIMVIPAFCYMYLRNGLFNLKTLIILVTIVGTFSATAYLSLLFFFVIKNFKPCTFKFYAILIFICGLSALTYLISDEVRYRIDDVAAYSQSGSLEEANATTFSAFSNLKVMFFSLKQNPFLGSGLGNHEKAYLEYFEDADYGILRRHGLNMQGGHSLFIRVLSETGLVGMLLILSFFYKFRITHENNIYYIISLASLMYFVGRIFKLGGYFDYGIYFFALSYLFSYFHCKKQRIQLPSVTNE